jgi:hypothetical protein
MRFAEQYNRWVSDKDALKYYKLKQAAQLGEEAEKLAFNYYENEKIKNVGILYGATERAHSSKPEKPQI